MQVNEYSSYKSTIVLNNINFQDWIALIKDSKYKETIITGRPYKFIDKNLYDKYKSSVPCITPNFIYNKEKADINIVKPTGLMYIDIDFNETSKDQFNPEILDKSKIYSYFKTFSGIGFGIIVQVDGLTKSNYSLTFDTICEELNISSYYDKSAKKASQYLALSYDPDVYFNNNSYVFSSVEDLNCEGVPPSVLYKKEKETYSQEWGTPESILTKKNKSLRMDNLDEIKFDTSHHVNPEGYDYVKVFIPYNTAIPVGKRYPTFMSITTNLVWLNPLASKEEILAYLNGVNNKCCEKPIAAKQLIKITDSIMKLSQDGKLKPRLFWKKRKILFHKGAIMTKEEKMVVVRKEVGKMKSEGSRKKLSEIINSWNFLDHGNISVRNISKHHPISKKTVEKYYKEFRDLVDEMNFAHKNLDDSLNVQHIRNINESTDDSNLISGESTIFKKVS